MNALKQSDPTSILRQLFGENRAEWPPDQFQELFVEPTYLRKLESKRPCFLVGGRGTGKTTSLQSLHYDATLQRLESQGLSSGDQEYFGILVRMNKNRVRAFDGGSVARDRWQKLFAHYINLLVCLELSTLGLWLEGKSGEKLKETSLKRISTDLGLDKAKTLQELMDMIRDGISKLQIQVNNPRSQMELTLSMAEAPLRTFVELMQNDGLVTGQVIFCCIDEYENLLDYQQAVLNTYIKHAEPPLSYKVGVRKNGLRNRQTLDGQDLLNTPDDYAEIEIVDEGFNYFARAVAGLRLEYAQKNGVNVQKDLKEFLADLSLSEEARLLGADKVAADVLADLKKNADPKVYEYFLAKPSNATYFLKYWLETSSQSLARLAEDWMQNEKAWEDRLGNYEFASLFWLSKGAKGVRIRKYYCGERVLLQLAAGNIRYFLELLDASISYELDEGFDPKKQLIISAKSQTLAARDVGKRKLSQLEGLADHGPQLKRLVLAVGKVFFELARSPEGHAPEITSFVLNGSSEDIAKVHQLLSDGVAHLAFEADPRTKATSNLELKDDEYRLHRIFCAFFEISHRKKRRATFDAKNLLAVFEEKPAKAISALLGGQEQTPDQALPEQLAFFSAFYDGVK